MSKPPIDPVVWQPPRATPRASQDASARAVEPRLIPLPGTGPEDVAIDAGGSAFTGLSDGRILRVSRHGAIVEVANTGGRPLGIEVSPDGDLIVCDTRRGVLRVDPGSGAVEVLVDLVDGARMLFCNNSTVGGDGTIYFTDSSTHFSQPDYLGELLAHTGTGRLFRRQSDGAIDLLAGGLDFANGVTLSPDGQSVVVAETGGYRLLRLWISGPRSGQRETFVENLPGFPDNISTGDTGLIWVALPNARSRLLDGLLPPSPLLRRAIWALPEHLRPKDKPTVWAQAYDDSGRLVHDLQTVHPSFRFVTGVRESAGTLWLGSLHSQAIGYVKL